MVEINPNRDDVLEMVVAKATNRVESQYFLLRRSSLKSFLAACALFLAALGFSGWAAVRTTMQSALAEALKTSGAQAAINELNTYRDRGKAANEELAQYVASAQRPSEVAFHAYLLNYRVSDHYERVPVKFLYDVPSFHGARSSWPPGGWADDESYIVPEGGVYVLIANFTRFAAGERVTEEAEIRVVVNGSRTVLSALAGRGDGGKPAFSHCVTELKQGDEIQVQAWCGGPGGSDRVKSGLLNLSVSGWRIGDTARPANDPAQK